MQNNNPLLELNDLEKKESKKTLLKKITFTVNKGDFFGLIGPNGAGKSTLIKLIVTYTTPTSGTIRYESQDIAGSKGKYREKIGYVPQEICLYPDLTVDENMSYFSKMYNHKKTETRKRISELLTMVDLKDHKDKLIKNLSGGMQRRLNIACSLIHNPELLILDEPVANLDHHQKQEIWSLLKSINSSGTTIIISSHLLHDLNELCSRVAFMHKGAIYFTGTPNELEKKFSQDIVVTIKTIPGNYRLILSAVRQYLTVSNYCMKNDYFVLTIKNTEYAVHDLVHVLDSLSESIVDMDIDKPSLDDTFEEIIRRLG